MLNKLYLTDAVLRGHRSFQRAAVPGFKKVFGLVSVLLHLGYQAEGVREEALLHVGRCAASVDPVKSHAGIS